MHPSMKTFGLNIVILSSQTGSFQLDALICLTNSLCRKCFFLKWEMHWRADVPPKRSVAVRWDICRFYRWQRWTHPVDWHAFKWHSSKRRKLSENSPLWLVHFQINRENVTVIEMRPYLACRTQCQFFPIEPLQLSHSTVRANRGNTASTLKKWFIPGLPHKLPFLIKEVYQFNRDTIVL